MTKVVDWIWKAPTLEERLKRIEEFLTNEGYSLSASPRDVDRSERGEKHIVYGEVWTVEYSVLDQTGRKVYHYRENEIDHVMLERIKHSDEWAIEHISRILQILKHGQIVSSEMSKIIYLSKQKYLHPELGIHVPLRVIVKRSRQGRWYIDTFHPRYRR
jgi:hypothetical protein